MLLLTREWRIKIDRRNFSAFREHKLNNKLLTHYMGAAIKAKKK